MRKLLLNIFIASAFTINFAFAQEISLNDKNEVELSFVQAYELMLNNNNALKATYEEIRQKTYKKRAALGQFLPKVGIDATYARLNDNIAINTATPFGTLTTPIQDKNLFETSVGAVWNIFTGGKIIALNSAARANLEGTNQKYRMISGDLTYELVKRYFGLRLALDVCEVKKQVMEGTKQHLENAKKLEKEGMIAKSERLHAEVAYKQAQREYKTSLRDIEIISDGLKALIKADDVDISYIRILPVSSLFTYEDELPSLEEFKKIAFENSPILKQMDVKKKLAKAGYLGELANYSPTVSLFAADILGSKDLSYLVPRWTMGVSANMMLFDGLARYHDVRAAGSFRKQVDYEIIDVQNNIQSLVTKQYQEIMKYKEQYESADTSLESAKEALRTSSVAFSEGFATSLDVVDAQLTEMGVKITRLNAIYNYDLSLTDLLKTCGKTAEITEYIQKSKSQNLD